MQKVGIITYHSAYNFGSALQAYATQQIIKSLGCETYIINYKIPFQRDYYGLLGYGKGLKAPLKKLMMVPQLSDRKKRAVRYEHFINYQMNLTEEISSPEEAKKFKDSFDVYVSGSDQIWNFHSNEYIHAGMEYMKPYLLHFTEKKKISYASSVVNMTDEELVKLKLELEKFSAISARERSAAQSLSKLLKIEIPTVLDPTLLMPGEKWFSVMPEEIEQYTKEPFILYYTLKNYMETKKDMLYLANLAAREGLKLVALTPLIPLIRIDGVINAASAGPWEFIDLIRRAKMVITDSYHGTLFSINLRKEFLYLRNKNGDHGLRASQLLDLMGIQDRMIDETTEVDFTSRVEYSNLNAKLENMRTKSIDYLKCAIFG